MNRDSVIQGYENQLKVFKVWLDSEEGTEIYHKLPMEVRNLLFRGEIVLEDRLTAMKNDFL